MRRPHARPTSHHHEEDNNNNKPDDVVMDPIHKHLHHPRPGKSKAAQPVVSSTRPVGLALLVAAALAAASLLYAYSDSWRLSSSSGRRRYGLVIDGGSTGTRIHVIAYRGGAGGGRPEIVEEGALRVNPGLSSYAGNPAGAGESLRELLEFARGKVPEAIWPETEVRMMATAGMRLLDAADQGRVVEECRRVLRGSGFKFRDEWASVIPGSDEGLYAWVVANYALGTLGADPSQTTGIIELGGASAQVTFVTREFVPSEFARTVTFGNVTYSIYSHSFLHFGQNVAYEAVRESLVSGEYRSVTNMLEKKMTKDPCTPKGYSVSSKSWELSPGSWGGESGYVTPLHPKGNFSECRSAALMLLQKGKENCSYQRCDIGSSFLPKLEGKFLATENFFYTSKFFGLGRSALLSDLIVAGQEFCGQEWSSLKRKHKLSSLHDEDLMHYCFSSAYIVALLHDSLGFSLDDGRIEYANEVGNLPLDWALGAFILHNSANFDAQHTDWMTGIIGDDSPTLFSLVAIAILLMFVAWSILKWRKPRLKTIYDLEKGRYIVTRISRNS